MSVSLIIIVLVTLFVFLTFNNYEKGKGISLVSVEAIGKNVFNSIYSNFVKKVDFSSNKDMYLYENNFSFSFYPDMTFCNFEFILGSVDNKESYRLTYDRDKKTIYAINNHLGEPSMHLKLNSFLSLFDNLDYDKIINSLNTGDLYSLSIYPQEPINKPDYVYSKEKLMIDRIFIYSKDGLQKVKENSISFNQESILFIISSMTNTKNDIRSKQKSYHSIDRVLLIVLKEDIV